MTGRAMVCDSGDMDPVERYRQAMGRFATGVTVIASGWGEELHAMTANAVTSLSLRPLQLLVCVRRESNCARALRRHGRFSVNVLRGDQEALSIYFSGAWKGVPPRFEFVPWGGVARLKGCIAAVACDVNEVLEGGDHYIVVGGVRETHIGPGRDPLIYHEGGYRELR